MQEAEKGYSYLIKATKINESNPVAYNNIGVTYFESFVKLNFLTIGMLPMSCIGQI